MKVRPILFSAPMVRASLGGSKSQTRRPYKIRKHPDAGCEIAASELVREPQQVIDRICPYGQPRDQLNVHETWQHSNHPFGTYDENCHVFYRADYPDDIHGPDGELSPEGRYRFWNPSIHMPRAASRILLEVAGVRIERLQGIVVDVAVEKGIERVRAHEDRFCHWRDYATSGRTVHPAYSYRTIWESINGPGSWDANPWVWVIEFKRVDAGTMKQVA